MSHDFDNNPWRADIPFFEEQPPQKTLVYLDNAATTQKPREVIAAILDWYATQNTNVHRGLDPVSTQGTTRFEQSRQTVAGFLNVDPQEVIFTSGTTESLNLLAHMLEGDLQVGDEVLVSRMEHHANFIPWQQLAKRVGATFKVIPLTAQGEVDLPAYKNLLSPKTKIVAIAHASNVTGTVNPVAKMAQLAHEHGAKVVVDGAQAVAHIPIDLQKLGVDFYAFSGHKVYGPMGIGVLWGKKNLLEQLEPAKTGGGMIESVSEEEITFAPIPQKLEAGTPNVAGAIGFAAAIRWLQDKGMNEVRHHEQELLTYAWQQLLKVKNIRLLGSEENNVGLISFVLEDIHPHDMGTVLGEWGVMIRSGHHCAQPLMKHFNLPATNRISLGVYNTKKDIDRCIDALIRGQSLFYEP